VTPKLPDAWGGLRLDKIAAAGGYQDEIGVW
jgi:hypothetical protein